MSDTNTYASALPEMMAGRAGDTVSVLRQIHETLEQVARRIAPVWPLQDYVAVNPLMGYADQKFLDASRFLRTTAGFDTLMDFDYYHDHFECGFFDKSDIDCAIDELVADGVTGAENLTANQILTCLHHDELKDCAWHSDPVRAAQFHRRCRSLIETIDFYGGTDWQSIVRDEVSRHCAAHYDQGQATWANPWRHLPLYQAWRSTAGHDANFEVSGVTGFRSFVASLPHTPEAALVNLLERLRVPSRLWDEFLLCEALLIPGWSAWTQYQARESAANNQQCNDFAGLLAIQLAHECAVAERLGFEVEWSHDSIPHPSRDAESTPEELLVRLALLRSEEIAFRRKLLAQLSRDASLAVRKSALMKDDDSAPAASATQHQADKLAQVVFCIDVRSERFRRHLESASCQIETFGFAGFFGAPIEYVPIGEMHGTSQVPALIRPQFRVRESVRGDVDSARTRVIARKSAIESLRSAWKEFQTSAASCFAFVEATGLAYGWKLLSRFRDHRRDASAEETRSRKVTPHLGPSLDGLSEQGLTVEHLAELAERILKNLGIVDFARLVVLCGHTSSSENNPLKAGLDCGACGGHSGEANARFVVALLNDLTLREALIDRGVVIPDSVRFVAAVHNTSTDVMELCDIETVPDSHLGDLDELTAAVGEATIATRTERLLSLPGPAPHDLLRRSRDWSEVRPEWGLAGNAAFMAGPRDLTRSVSLKGRVFLHSYDHRHDADFIVLEQIMTAPLIVAHWINMQYYASVADPMHFGSGNKTIHNVVGRFGLLSGNGGDLMTGLPWQSVHDGQRLRHQPLRLLGIIAAPRAAIEKIVRKHEMLRNLVGNGWLQLIAIDQDRNFRFTERCHWEEIQSDRESAPAQQLMNC